MLFWQFCGFHKFYTVKGGIWLKKLVSVFFFVFFLIKDSFEILMLFFVFLYIFQMGIFKEF